MVVLGLCVRICQTGSLYLSPHENVVKTQTADLGEARTDKPRAPYKKRVWAYICWQLFRKGADVGAFGKRPQICICTSKGHYLTDISPPWYMCNSLNIYVKLAETFAVNMSATLHVPPGQNQSHTPELFTLRNRPYNTVFPLNDYRNHKCTSRTCFPLKFK